MRATDLGHGRGWLDTGAAASVRRLDRELGHPLQVTEAGRTWARQNEHYQTYLRVGYPIALSPDAPSVHQEGEALDSDEAQRHLDMMHRHGWRRTVYRNGKLIEPWHFEYYAHLDQHRGDPAPAGEETTPAPIPEPEPEEDNMKVFGYIKKADGRKWYVQFDSTSGFWSEFVTNDEDYARSVAEKFGGGAPLLTEKHRDDLKAERDALVARIERSTA